MRRISLFIIIGLVLSIPISCTDVSVEPEVFKAPTSTGKNIAIYLGKSSYNSQKIFIYDYDTQTSESIPEERSFTHPTISTDGKFVLYTAWTGIGRSVILYDRDTGDKTELAGGNLYCLNPVFIMNNEKVLFYSTNNSSVNPISNIYIVNIDGSELKQLTSNMNDCIFPVYSKESNKIYFLSNYEQDKIYTLYSMNLNGENLTTLKNEFNLDFEELIISKDGKSFYALAYRKGYGRALYRYSILDQKAHHIDFETSIYKTNISITPIDSYISYSSNESGVYKAYLVNIDKKVKIRAMQLSEDIFENNFYWIRY